MNENKKTSESTAPTSEWGRAQFHHPVLPGCVGWACAGDVPSEHVVALQVIEVVDGVATCNTLSDWPPDFRTFRGAAALPNQLHTQEAPLQVPVWAIRDCMPPSVVSDPVLTRSYLAAFFHCSDRAVDVVASLCVLLSDLGQDADPSLGLQIMFASTDIPSSHSTVFIDGVAGDTGWQDHLETSLAPLNPDWRANYSALPNSSGAIRRQQLLVVGHVSISIGVDVLPETDEGPCSCLWIAWKEADDAQREVFFTTEMERHTREVFGLVDEIVKNLPAEKAMTLLSRLSADATAKCATGSAA